MHILTAARRLFAAAALLTLALVARDPAALADAAPTGRTLKEAVFSNGDQSPLGSFRRVADGTWQEVDANGALRFTFTELRRDDWTVYLLDQTRGIEIRLDLHQRQVLYVAGGQQPYPIYAILYAMSDAPTGLTVTRVDASLDGQIEVARFQTTGQPGEWVEQNTYGEVAYRFTESSRDEGSVYLQDASRGVWLQLDLTSDTIYYGVNGGSLSPLYKINLKQ